MKHSHLSFHYYYNNFQPLLVSLTTIIKRKHASRKANLRREATGEYDGEAFVPGFAQNHTTREKIDPIGSRQNKQIAVVLPVFSVCQPMNNKKCVMFRLSLRLVCK